MISVIIPCRNERNYIKECIDAIYKSEIDLNDLEVLVVDGMSDDGTLEELESLKKKYSSLKIIPNLQKVTPIAFNLGIKKSMGYFIQIVGARQIISSNYLFQAKKVLENDENIGCVGGAVENIYQTYESELIGLAMGSSFGVGVGNFRVVNKSHFTDTVGTPMYRRSIFDEIGFFNESLHRNQDDEFNYRIKKNGKKIFLNSDMKIKYYVRGNKKNLMKQYYQYGYWKIYVNRMHKTLTNLRQLVPALFVSGLFLGLFLSFFHSLFFTIYAAFLLLYFFLSFGFGVFIAKAFFKGLKVALIFPFLHISYGCGYLMGLYDFFLFKKKPSKANSNLSR